MTLNRLSPSNAFLTSVHADHLGIFAIPKVNAGTCAKPGTSAKMMPNSNTATIIAKTGAVNYSGGLFTSGPKEAAFSINELIKPNAVIPQHMNEEATKGGKLVAGSRTAKLKSLIKGIPVHIALSGRTMEFDGNAKCVSGC